MPLTVRIQNLGKLADATVRVGGLTVLAGPNNTGKSFFSKALYSVFDALNANHAKVAVDEHALPLRSDLWWAEHHGRRREKKPDDSSRLSAVIDSVGRLAEAAGACSLRDAAVVAHPGDQPYLLLQQTASELNEAYRQFKPQLEGWINLEESSSRFSPFSLDEKFLARMDYRVDSLRKLGGMTAHALTSRGLSCKVSSDLLENFQVRTLSDLKKNGGAPLVVKLQGVGEVIVGDDDEAAFQVQRADLLRQQYSRVLYLESPALWKLQGALESIREEGDPDEVGAAPGYFYELAVMMKKDYRGKPIIPEELERVASRVVRGRVVLENPGGRLVFHEADGGRYPLSRAAMGVANLGVLAMLVERGVVARDSLLFIDEPEAHLHPKWQVEMARLLFELAKAGVRVVIATHSVDIVKWLQVRVEKHPEDERLIELNPFTEAGVVNGDADFSDKLPLIMRELTGPFHKLYMRGL